ncbi:hypothetical protein [Demequina soli]|uniref:hypothetical protein n=1 Tax=Demequina soli TaxID=1638987 RepID=UPI000784F1F5|nr:hypothetical protein [Demequina soli]
MTSSEAASASAATTRGVALLALAIAVAGIAQMAFVGGYYADRTSPLGHWSDASALLLGVLTAALVVTVAVTGGRPVPRVGLTLTALAVAGCAVAVKGSLLILTATTDWFAAGVVGGVGWSLAAPWMWRASAVDDARRPFAPASPAHGVVGRVTALVVALGILGLPFALSGADPYVAGVGLDGAAPWPASVALLAGGLGALALWPAWCAWWGVALLRRARRDA